MKILKIAGGLTALAAVAHIAIIVGGADWYRFFGAGEEMATMSEHGFLYPALLTGLIATMLAIWSAYAFSGAGVIRLLPFTNKILALISIVFLVRGIFAIPAVLLSSSPYMLGLADKMPFMVMSSLYCLLLGSCFGYGVYCRTKHQGHA